MARWGAGDENSRQKAQAAKKQDQNLTAETQRKEFRHGLHGLSQIF
jgi:hypothetical protein